MKPITFLAAFTVLGFATASHSPTSSTAHAIPAPLNRGVDLIWDPLDAYKYRPKKRKQWEETCTQALAEKGCFFGTVHQGVRSAQPDDGIISYVNVEAGPTVDTRYARKMRVLEDASTEDGWHEEDVARIAAAKRPRGRKTDHARPQMERKALIRWDPEGVYRFLHRMRRYWEHRCDQALTREGCLVGVIHRGITKTTKNGVKTSYVNVEGAPSSDWKNPKKLRVYEDTSTEDFTKDGWTEDDERAMKYAKRPRPVRKMPPQEHVGSSHTITWNPPDAYGVYPKRQYNRLRQAYENACHKALDREGCDFGIIHTGLHRYKKRKTDGPRAHYMVVTAGKHGKSGPDMRYMRLFEDGSSIWYPPGPLPRKDAMRRKGKTLVSSVPRDPSRREMGTPVMNASESLGNSTERQGSTGTHEAVGAEERPMKRPRTQSTSIHVPTRAAYSVGSPAPGEGQHAYSTTQSLGSTQVPSQGPTQAEHQPERLEASSPSIEGEQQQQHPEAQVPIHAANEASGDGEHQYHPVTYPELGNFQPVGSPGPFGLYSP